MKKLILSCLSASCLTLSASAFAQDSALDGDRFKPRVYGNLTIIEEAVPVQSPDVIEAQAVTIRPGDVSPEEYMRIQEEARRIRAYRNRTQSPTYSYQAPQGQSQYQHQSQPQQQSAPLQEMELYQSPVLRSAQTFQTTQVNNSVPQSHVVVEGDTLYSLSKRYNVRLQDLRSANGIKDNIIGLGQVLVLPIYENTATLPYQGNTVAQNGYSPVQPQRITRQTDSYVTAPRNSVRRVDTNTNVVYAVLPNDTLFGIARRTCTTPRDIALTNNLELDGDLSPGQRLVIPKGHCLIR
jgi:LysM repeat protein